MKKLKLYTITKRQFENMEYRPTDVFVDESIETEDDWNYGDVVANMEEYTVELVKECTDLYVWKLNPWSKEKNQARCFVSYIVEKK